MHFKYKGIDSLGNKTKGTIEASTFEEAKLKLKSKKIIYKSIKEDNNVLKKINPKQIRKIKTIELANISRDISIYLNSGISLVNAIKLISQRYKKDKKLNTFFESLTNNLQEGKNFYTALEIQKTLQIPEFYKQSIKVSENGGLLQSVLLELSKFLKEQDRIKKQMSSALAYPLFILFVSFAMVGFMLGYIVPKITSIFQQLNQSLPTSTKIVITLGEFISNNIYFISIIVAIATLSFLVLINKSKSFKYFIDKTLLKIPFINKLIELSELSRFSYMNSILMRSGVPAVQSYKLSADILKNSVLKKVFFKASLKVVEGERFSKILDNSKIYKVDSAFIHAIAIGEETSELSTVLSNQAELYNEANKDKISIFLSLLEPALMLIVGSIIGFIVISMLLPIFSINLN